MSTKAERVKLMIERPDGAFNWELNQISFRYGATIHNLRKQGYEIESKMVNSDGLWWFKLHPKKHECQTFYIERDGASKCTYCHKLRVNPQEQAIKDIQQLILTI